jgi:cysteine desulfurase
MWPFTRTNTTRIYADYAAATPVDKQVLQAMQPYWSQYFANPNAQYESARTARAVLDDCVQAVRQTAGMSKEGSVIWTSGGTESNHLAIDFAIKQWKALHPREEYTIIISSIEHPSVVDFVESITDPLCTIVYIKVDREGGIQLDDLGARLPSVVNPIIVSCIFQSSEVGTTQPIKEIAKLVHKHRQNAFPYMHTDASQGMYYHSLNFQDWGIDMCTICGQKIGAPKGSGALLASPDIDINREGTPAVPLIVGLTAAWERAQSQVEASRKRIQEQRTLLFKALDYRQVSYVVNGDTDANSLVVNLSFPDCARDSESLIVAMDQLGVEVSSKSACVGSQQADSRVLAAMGANPANSLRISLHHTMSEGDISRIAEALAEVVNST